jgi:hypothetical protein
MSSNVTMGILFPRYILFHLFFIYHLHAETQRVGCCEAEQQVSLPFVHVLKSKVAHGPYLTVAAKKAS